jgi:hypothetical protein
VGLLGEAAGSVGNGDIDTNGNGCDIGGGNDIDNSIQLTTLGMVRDQVIGFILDVVGGASEASEGGKEREDSIKGVMDVVMEG